MAKILNLMIRRIFLKSKSNLLSLDEPYQVIQRLLSGYNVNVAIDAGASNGRISRRLLKLFPRSQVYAFEPNPIYRAVLSEFEGNDKRFHPRYYALSDRESEIDLQVTESAGNTSLFTPGPRLKTYQPEGTRIKHVEKVRAVTLDHWTMEENISGVEFMKFDIQGAELMALKGAEKLLSESTLVIYTEVLFNSLYDGGAIFSDIDQYLRKYGFELYNFYKPKHDKNDLLLWANAIFIHCGRLGI
jgi:FkbM family methyltransferase